MIKQDITYWNGCLPRLKMRPPRFGADSETIDTPLKHWISRCVPTYNQQGESCVGEGWSNFLEIVLREYVAPSAIPDNRQLNGYAVWWKAKQLYYKGVLSGGLQIPEGFEAMKALGWIPEDTLLVEVGDDWISQGVAMMETPLVVGHMVTQGWFNPDPKNGCLDHAPVSNRTSGGHCTCRVGRHLHNGIRFYSGLNSWGDEYANHGIFLMDEELDEYTTLDTPYTIAITGGFSRLREHLGWKAGLISTPKGIR